MAVSMTGYGRSKIEAETFTITVEIRSVNHRFLDCHFRMPQQFLKMEDKMKKAIQSYISRGRVDCFISVDGENVVNRQLHIDWELIDEYYQFINRLKNRFQLEGEVEVSHFLQQDQLLSVVERETENQELERLLLRAIEEAAANLKRMRASEGERLERDLVNHLTELEKKTVTIKELAPKMKDQYEEKIYKKLSEVTNGVVDESRVLTEIALLAERTDITEELTRLASHLTEFRATVAKSEPVGRKLDFLVQEMNRETNTIGSKANDLEISRAVVDMKSILEKMREQVQNIE